MSPAEARELSDVALRVATEAAALAARGYRHPKRVSKKGTIDLVTEFDLESEALIKDRLKAATPSIPAVGEERGGDAGGSLTWYVDPIDGTTNYAHGHPFWCVSIGLVDREGRALAGAVVAPALHTHWLASLGAPALRNGEPCRVSEVSAFEDSLLATGFPYDRRTSEDNNFDAFCSIKKRVQAVRRCGSAALDLCLVADGTYDGYWERKLKPWDLAAGSCLVAAAGGLVSDMTGGAPDLLAGHLVATNARIHDALVLALGAR